MAMMRVVVVSVLGSAAISTADLECQNHELSVDTDEEALLSLRASKHTVGRSRDDPSSLDGTTIFFGNKTVVAVSPEPVYTQDNGWYGAHVGYVNSEKLMAFEAGGKCPTSFYLRPRVGTEPSGCLQYGQQVVIAESSDPGETRVCKWYGCKVGGVQDGELAFFAGGADPQAFYVLPPAGSSGECVKFGDAVVLSDSPVFQRGATDVLFMSSEGIMSFGPAPDAPSFFLRPPACGEGPVDVCKTASETIDAAMSIVEDKIDEKLKNITAEKDPIKKTKYWWNIAFTSPLFGTHWSNSAGRKMSAHDFANAEVNTNLKVSQCEPSGLNMTLTASGLLQMKWIDQVGASVTFFYHGFVSFMKIEKKISVELTDLKLEAFLNTTLTTKAGITDSVCLSEATLKDCTLRAGIVVKGVPNFKHQIEQKIKDGMDNAAASMCSSAAEWDEENLPKCISLR